MKPQSYAVCLTDQDRKHLSSVHRGGSAKARELRRARILLKADRNGPSWSDQQIGEALDCSATPEGRKRWTLELSAERLVRLGHVGSLCRETVCLTLKKTRSSRI